MQLISEPLDRSTCNKYGTFQNISDLSVKAPSDRRNQSVLGKYRLISCIHQKETTGSICILGLTFLKAGLTEQRRLLITGRTSHRDSSTEKGRICLTINLAGLFYLRKHTLRNIQLLQDLIIPLQSIDVEHHGSGCIGIIGYMNSTLGQLPDQPGFHGTEEKFSLLRPFTCTFHIIQDPFHFGCGKIRINNKSCFLTEFLLKALCLQTVTVF